VGNRVGFEVAVRSEERFSAVWVKGGTFVFDGVIVTDAVMVGVAEIRGVAVAVNEAVLVGRVEVGNGPSSASAVPAMAVFSPDTPPCDCPPSPEAVVSRNVTAKTTTIRPRHKVTCSNACSGIRFCFFTLTDFLQSQFLEVYGAGWSVILFVDWRVRPRGISQTSLKTLFWIRFVAYLSFMTEILRKGYRGKIRVSGTSLNCQE
jgi:hypothetical protein